MHVSAAGTCDFTGKGMTTGVPPLPLLLDSFPEQRQSRGFAAAKGLKRSEACSVRRNQMNIRIGKLVANRNAASVYTMLPECSECIHDAASEHLR